MCKTYKLLPDDSFFDSLDQNPVLKLMMYEHWLLDQEEEYDRDRGFAILTGSFTNPAAAKEMLKAEEPDFSSTNEDFEKSCDIVKNSPAPIKMKKKMRKRLEKQNKKL